MFKLIKEFFSENGQGSSKRLIGIAISGVLAWGITYSVCMAKTANERYSLVTATMVFVLVMSGVATVAQIVSLVRGGKPEKDDETKPTP